MFKNIGEVRNLLVVLLTIHITRTYGIALNNDLHNEGLITDVILCKKGLHINNEEIIQSTLDNGVARFSNTNDSNTNDSNTNDSNSIGTINNDGIIRGTFTPTSNNETSVSRGNGVSIYSFSDSSINDINNYGFDADHRNYKTTTNTIGGMATTEYGINDKTSLGFIIGGNNQDVNFKGTSNINISLFNKRD